MGKGRKPTQFLKVLNRIIFSDVSGIDGYLMRMTAARNDVSLLERLYLEERVNRKWEKTSDGFGRYLRYEVANAEQLRKVIAVYKAKGGELTEAQEKQAYSRFE